MQVDPVWLHELQHFLAERKGECKVCRQSKSNLYNCKACMIGIYCSVDCQHKDISHPCLIGVKEDKRKQVDDNNPAEQKKRKREEFNAFVNLLANYPDVVQAIAETGVLSARELLRMTTELSKTLSNRDMPWSEPCLVGCANA